MAKRKLHVDIETFSSIDIKSAGAYKYVESPDFEILMIAYAIDNNPIRVVDLACGESVPEEFMDALKDPETIKCAHNATFERNAFKQYNWIVPIEQWFCTSVKSAYCGLPLSLELVSKALKLEEKGKLSTGKALIRYFCVPCKPTKANGMRRRNLPHHDWGKWAEFKQYCLNDVEAEREIDHRLEQYPLHEFEADNYIIDQEINDRGIIIDTVMAQHAIDIDNRFEEEVVATTKEITGVDNPNSPTQLKEWLTNALGTEVKSLAKDDVVKLITDVGAGTVADVLNSRLLLAKSSTKKYVAMINCVCDDGRAHGLFQFLGANRTGRWAGRLIQLQNLFSSYLTKEMHLKKINFASLKLWEELAVQNILY